MDDGEFQGQCGIFPTDPPLAAISNRPHMDFCAMSNFNRVKKREEEEKETGTRRKCQDT